jgi:hypothetical protein
MREAMTVAGAVRARPAKPLDSKQPTGVPHTHEKASRTIMDADLDAGLNRQCCLFLEFFGEDDMHRVRPQQRRRGEPTVLAGIDPEAVCAATSNSTESAEVNITSVSAPLDR